VSDQLVDHFNSAKSGRLFTQQRFKEISTLFGPERKTSHLIEKQVKNLLATAPYKKCTSAKDLKSLISSNRQLIC